MRKPRDTSPTPPRRRRSRAAHEAPDAATALAAKLCAMPLVDLARAVVDMAGIAHTALHGVELYVACVFRPLPTEMLEIHALRLLAPMEAIESYLPTMLEAHHAEGRRLFWLPMELREMDEADLALAVTLPRRVWLLPPGSVVEHPTEADAGKYRECTEAEFEMLRRVYDRATPEAVRAVLRRR